MNISELKTKENVTREDIASLLKSIAPPGKKQGEKIKAIRAVGGKNFQGQLVELTLNSYMEY